MHQDGHGLDHAIVTRAAREVTMMREVCRVSRAGGHSRCRPVVAGGRWRGRQTVQGGPCEEAQAPPRARSWALLRG